MPNRAKKPISDLDLKIDPGLAKAFKENQAARGDLYPQVFEADDVIAMYIREQVTERFPHDLNAREIAAELALEVAHIDRAQFTVDGLSKRLFGEIKETSTDKARVDLPPAA